MKLLMGLMIVMSSALAFAGEATEIFPIGFSKGGTYYAWVEAGVGDGSGAGFAEAFIVDVAKNKLVAQTALYTAEDDTSDDSLNKAVAQAKKLLAKDLKTFAITPNEYLGQTLVSRLPTDRGADGGVVSFSAYGGPVGGAGINYYKTYNISLYTEVDTTKDYEYCNQSYGEKLKVVLTSEEFDESKVIRQILQKDKSLPGSRECATAYGVTQVVYFEDSLVVFVSYLHPGFEGPSSSQIAVTGKVKLEI